VYAQVVFEQNGRVQSYDGVLGTLVFSSFQAHSFGEPSKTAFKTQRVTIERERADTTHIFIVKEMFQFERTKK